MTRCGFVAIAGRPNVGKSTLINHLVGSKVAVASDKPQTTRRAIRGIANGERDGSPFQLVLVDLPGVQRPRDELTTRMQRRVDRELTECDVALMVLNAAEGVGPGDRFIARALVAAKKPVLIAVNKIDAVGRDRIVEGLFEAARLEDAGLDVHGVFPISARTGEGVDVLLDTLVPLMPEGQAHYPADERTDQRPELLLAELIRGQALARMRDEIPHSIEVQVDEIEEREDGVFVAATLMVETESQKKILIGRQGSMIKSIGTDARQEIQFALQDRAHLNLRVQVRKGWRGDGSLLDRLGIEG